MTILGMVDGEVKRILRSGKRSINQARRGSNTARQGDIDSEKHVLEGLGLEAMDSQPAAGELTDPSVSID
jgi:hypothetical protein